MLPLQLYISVGCRGKEVLIIQVWVYKKEGRHKLKQHHWSYFKLQRIGKEKNSPRSHYKNNNYCTSCLALFFASHGCLVLWMVSSSLAGLPRSLKSGCRQRSARSAKGRRLGSSMAALQSSLCLSMVCTHSLLASSTSK